ncbi:unnamed protein product [Caenorhabditis sp. 36 PRJEB53466]|nr:unnamed protein product [Caenorhabditis sp. 36 PRJEB53466]
MLFFQHPGRRREILMGEVSEKPGGCIRSVLQAVEVRRRQGEDGDAGRSHASGSARFRWLLFEHPRIAS